VKRFLFAASTALVFVLSSFAGPTSVQEVSAQSAPVLNLYGTGQQGSNQVINVVNSTTGSVTKSILDPSNIAFMTGIVPSPDGKRLYGVGQRNDGSGGFNIVVFSTASNTVIDNYSLDICLGNPAISPDGKKLYVVNTCKKLLYIVDVDTRANQALPIAIGSTSPQGLGVTKLSPDGRFLYLLATGSCYICDVGTVWVFDVANGRFTTQIPAGPGPLGIAVNPSGKTAYITNYNAPGASPNYGNTVTILNLESSQRIGTYTVGKGPVDIAITPDGKKVYVSNRADATVSVIHTDTGGVDTKSLGIGVSPNVVTVSPDGSKAYFSYGYGIAALDAANNVTLWKFPAGIQLGSSLTIATPPPVIASLATKPTKVVLLQGIGTTSALNIQSLQQNCTRTDIFPKVVNTLLDAGFQCSDFLLYSYNGGQMSSFLPSINSTWQPNPYLCGDTNKYSISRDTTNLQHMLSLYHSQFPTTRFVLIGHSLGGLIAFEAAPNTGLPNGTIPAVVTIDSPLNHTSAQNLTDANKVIPFAEVLTTIECSARSLLDSVPSSELANMTDGNRLSILVQQSNKVFAGKNLGISYMTVGNNQDCLWYLTICNMPRHTLDNTFLSGDWLDDRFTMQVGSADVHKLYNLGNSGCNLTNLPLALVCLTEPHGLALKDDSVQLDIINFLRGILN
jgi:YVTN family beta-propeller protein